MYLDTITRIERAYGQRWHQGIGTCTVTVGTLRRTYDRYQCETCGRTVETLRVSGEDKPSEPFYCSCNGLIQV